MLRQLGSCAWVGEHLNVLIAGATGVGKSYLACALGQSACRKGLRVLYRRVPRLLDELALARAEGSYARLLSKLAKADVWLAVRVRQPRSDEAESALVRQQRLLPALQAIAPRGVRVARVERSRELSD